jgi:hypothetical protein
MKRQVASVPYIRRCGVCGREFDLQYESQRQGAILDMLEHLYMALPDPDPEDVWRRGRAQIGGSTT